jgi:rhodanese-related sulfurtransferase
MGRAELALPAEENEAMPLPFRPGVDNVPEIDHQSAAAAHRAGTALFVDVREPDEWEAGHIPGAVHIPLGDLPFRLAELPPTRDLILVCHSGGRSFAATAFLLQNRYPRAVNLEGGMVAWQAADHPIEV